MAKSDDDIQFWLFMLSREWLGVGTITLLHQLIAHIPDQFLMMIFTEELINVCAECVKNLVARETKIGRLWIPEVSQRSNVVPKTINKGSHTPTTKHFWHVNSTIIALIG